jgi:ABC-type branched-subunit amino acid transport system substrate-binding protein
MTDERRRGITRRRFLQAAGGSAGLAALSPLASASRAAAATGARVKLGVLVPSGGDYPAMGANFLEGLRLGAERTGLSASFSVADVPLGYDGAYTAARTLLASGVDVVVAGVTTPVARQITSLFEDAGVTLVAASAGGHLVRPADRSPAVVHHSLGYWQASFAIGRWAAANAGATGFVATSLADSGYDAVYAYRRGLESAGGRVADDLVTHVDGGAAGLSSAVGRSGARHVHALYSAGRALDALRALSSTGMPVLAGAFAVDESLLRRLGTAAVGVRSAFSWSPALATNANRSFIRAFRERAGRRPDAFAVLGHDAAALIAAGMSRAGSSRGLVAALDGATVASPRGQLKVESGAVLMPQYLRQVRSVNGKLVNSVVGPLEAVGDAPDAMSSLAAAIPSGYLNEVLCPA